MLKKMIQIFITQKIHHTANWQQSILYSTRIKSLICNLSLFKQYMQILALAFPLEKMLLLQLIDVDGYEHGAGPSNCRIDIFGCSNYTHTTIVNKIQIQIRKREYKGDMWGYIINKLKVKQQQWNLQHVVDHVGIGPREQVGVNV